MAKLSEKFKPGDLVGVRCVDSSVIRATVCSPLRHTLAEYENFANDFDIDEFVVMRSEQGAEGYANALNVTLVQKHSDLDIKRDGRVITIDQEQFDKEVRGTLLDPTPKHDHTHNWKPYYGLSHTPQGYDCECGERGDA